MEKGKEGGGTVAEGALSPQPGRRLPVPETGGQGGSRGARLPRAPPTRDATQHGNRSEGALQMVTDGCKR